MSIASAGFLSPEVHDYIEAHRRQFADEFSFADQVNATCQALLVGIQLDKRSATFHRDHYISLLFARTLSNFQGVVTLAERGMIVESRILLRSCFESACALRAVAIHGESYLDRVIAAHQLTRQKFTNWTLGQPSILNILGVERREQLQTFAAEIAQETRAELSIHDMAQDAGLLDLYIIYRELSDDAAHPGLGALNRYVEAQPSAEERLLWGPALASAQMADTIRLACCFSLVAAWALNDALGASYSPQINAHLVRYMELMNQPEETGPSSESTSSLTKGDTRGA